MTTPLSPVGGPQVVLPVARFSLLAAVVRWFDSSRGYVAAARDSLPDRIDWARILPFVLMHAACLGVFWVGVSPVAVRSRWRLPGAHVRHHGLLSPLLLAPLLQDLAPGQFIFGLLGASAVQRGPVWWAAHHRYHHANSDQDADLHSPLAARLLALAHGLVPVDQGLRAGSALRARSA